MEDDGVGFLMNVRGLLLTAMQRLNMSASDSPACRALLAEIWGHICAHVDVFSLWIACRQVSKMVRAEAEREFARTRLPQLKLGWNCRRTTQDGVCVNFKAGLGDGNTQLIGFSAEGNRAHFRVRIKSYVDIGGNHKCYPGHEDRDMSLVNDALQAALTDTDPKLLFRPNSILGCFVGVDPLPVLEVDMDAQTCSFGRKAFLDMLFRGTALMGKLTCPQAPFQAVAGSFDRLRKEIGSGIKKLDPRQSFDFSCRTVGRGEDLLYQKAYSVRWKGAYKNQGLEHSYERHAWKLAYQVARFRMFRNAYLARQVMMEHGIDVSRVIEPESFLIM
jgi:hypothetical protein